MDSAAVSAARETAQLWSPTAASQSAAVPEEKRSTNIWQSDTIDLSEEGKDLSLSSENLVPGKLFERIETADGISFEELSGLLRDKSAALRDDLDTLFERAGIDTSREIDLTVGYDGDVLVSGDHPDKARIEKLFADNPELSNNFRAVSALSSLAQALQEGVEFQKAYAQDPEAAVAQYSYLFNDNYNPQFNYSYSSDSSSIYFTDLFHSGRQYLEY